METATLTEQTIKRLPRHKRINAHGLSLQLQNRDREILKLVYDYRFLTSNLIRVLAPGSDQVILRRLQKLFHHGYLDRVKALMYEPFVYGLGNKGADELAIFYGLDRGIINWTTKNRETKDHYINHALMVANFRAVLNLALKDMSDKGILSWTPEGKKLKDEVVVEGENRTKVRLPLVPDAFFALHDPNDKMFFFLEADRSTMTNQRFLKKMTAYWNYWQQGKHKSKHEINAFRVLTITRTEARKENLRKITKEADKHKKGSEMFWFASEESYNLENPKTLLNPIWQTPKDNTYHHLFE